MDIRRLIGPTVISLVLSGLLIDYLFFADSRWSVVRLVAKIAVIVGAIFGPAFNPQLYGWAKDLTVPALLSFFALVLLGISIARAKTAMNKATPDFDGPLPRSVPQPALAKPNAISESSPIPSQRPRRQVGLLVKSVCGFAVVSMLFLVAICLIAHQYLYRTMAKNFQDRADTMALGVAEVSGQQFASGRAVNLPAAVASYAAGGAVAYVYVEDADGKIVAHTPHDLPRFLNRDFPTSSERAIDGAEAQYRGLEVYEVAKRIEGRRGGYAHVAVWRSAIEEETRLAMLPIVAATFAVLLGTLAVFVCVIRSIDRPFRQLVFHAGRISKGDLEVTLELKRPDEIGEIAQSLERMRSSLHAAVKRLEQ